MGTRSCKTICSAFRAVGENRQTVESGDKVLYPMEVFDLNNEYNPATSTFRPKNAGVYHVTASVIFFPDPNPPAQDYLVEIAVRVNGSFEGGLASGNTQIHTTMDGNFVSVTGILQLEAGDEVDVQIFPVDINGFIDPRPFATHFEAARFPSPNFTEPVPLNARNASYSKPGER